MTANRDPEQILASWLDEGPTDLPDSVRRSILVALPTTTQARRGPIAPWRFSMLPKLLAATAAVVVILVGGVAILGGGLASVGSSPTPTLAPASPTVAPSPAPQTTLVDESATAGYTFTAPADWQFTQTGNTLFGNTRPPITSLYVWSGTRAAGSSTPFTIDEGKPATGQNTFSGKTVAELLAGDDAWWQRTNGAPPTNEHQVTVAGETAWVTQHEDPGNHFLYLELIATHGDRAINLQLAAPKANAAELQAAFDAIVASFHWAP